MSTASLLCVGCTVLMLTADTVGVGASEAPVPLDDSAAVGLLEEYAASVRRQPGATAGPRNETRVFWRDKKISANHLRPLANLDGLTSLGFARRNISTFLRHLQVGIRGKQ